jgi:hypothetical protein
MCSSDHAQLRDGLITSESRYADESVFARVWQSFVRS